MVYEPPYKMSWPKKPVKIEDGNIVAIDGIPAENYNPFDFYGESESLYLKFISIDKTKPDCIKDFVNEYGFLGINSFKRNKEKLEEWNEKTKKLDIKDAFFVYAKDYLGTNKESIEDIKTEIINMRRLINLWEAIKSHDLDTMLREIEFFEGINLLEHKEEINLIFVQWWAQKTIAFQINQQLSFVVPRLSFKSLSEYYKRPLPIFYSVWDVPDLLSAMYTMIYMDLLGGKTIRKCRNESCSKWFSVYGNDDRKIYCSSRCANTQAKRMERRRKKEKRESE